uniref:RNA helicase n=4 Tax=Spongospora subterranea TaxID=70186 RepID=A0A0H5QLJ2_9EUKA|eukprot:CRZ02472.1 hypothetical protein [Spongospora subterranea]
MDSVMVISEPNRVVDFPDIDVDNTHVQLLNNMGSNVKSQSDIQRQRMGLPIYKHKSRLISSVKENASLVVIGETGSGKTTQLPQYLLESGLIPRKQMIVISQPRRVAAITVANRVAQEMNVKLGQEVGYCIRFDDRTSPKKTRMKFVTDGMLLQECCVDPDLSRYTIVILDEAHERTVHTDVLLALVKRAQTRRSTGDSPLKVICMSATIEADKFAKFLQCPIERIKGRTFPVAIEYLNHPENDFIDASLIAVLQVHMDMPVDGDILCFLTGQEDIDSLQDQIVQRAKLIPDRPVIVCPIYAALPESQQMLVFQPTPPNTRKIILATNIAETSLTIDGVKYVIDCGLSKKRQFHSFTGIDTLTPSPIAKSEAWQRAGRAGRQQAGHCYRLYTEATFDQLRDVAIPEIKRCNLASVVLQLKSLGVDDIMGFEFMDPPDREPLIQALMHLYELSALDNRGALTDLGRRMSRFALEPAFSKVLLASADMNCTDQILTIIAMLSSDQIFYYPSSGRELADAARKKFYCPSGDHMMLLRVYNAAVEVNVDRRWCSQNFINARAIRKAQSIRHQLASSCKRIGVRSSGHLSDDLSPEADEYVRRCLASGLFLNSAVLQADGTYRTHTDQLANIHPTSSLFNQRSRPFCVVFTELVHTTKLYMRTVSGIDASWLPEVAPRLGFKRAKQAVPS